MFFLEDPCEPGHRSLWLAERWDFRGGLWGGLSPWLQGRSVTPGCWLDDVSFFSIQLFHPFWGRPKMYCNPAESEGTTFRNWCSFRIYGAVGKTTGKNSQSIFPSKYPLKSEFPAMFDHPRVEAMPRRISGNWGWAATIYLSLALWSNLALDNSTYIIHLWMILD